MKPLPSSATVFSLLRSQEFGGRKECLFMLDAGAVEWARGYNDADPDGLSLDHCENSRHVSGNDIAVVALHGEALPVLSALHIALHNPANVECSRTPTLHASVFDLFPAPFLRRGLQPVGRLDADTTGLLLLTDDGLFNHAITAPRRKLPKTYRVVLKHPLSDVQIQALEKGVVLRDDPEPTAPALVRKISEREADIVITEGRYHQVKRMAAAVGNRVESLHRSAIGPLEIGELAEGAWRHLTAGEIAALGK